MIQVVAVPWDEHEPITTVDLEHNDVKGFEGLLGGPMDPVRLASRHPGRELDAVMLINRNGVLLGLKPNFRATQVLAARGIYHNSLPYFIGPAVFAGLTEGFLFASCPPSVVNEVVTQALSAPHHII